jgi:hypothetical protein
MEATGVDTFDDTAAEIQKQKHVMMMMASLSFQRGYLWRAKLREYNMKK